MKIRIVHVIALFGLATTLVNAGTIPRAELAEIRFDQRLNHAVSKDLSFRDEAGREVRLRDYFGTKPVALIMGYYECPMLCTLVLNGFIETLHQLRPDVGEKFDLIMVSINPAETPSLAWEKKQNYLRRYGRRGAESQWHFLTGDEQAVRQLAEEIGFSYALDKNSNEYAHPSGFVVLTPDGVISRYFFGMRYAADELQIAIDEAAARKISSPIREFLLLCFHYNPLTGKYGGFIMNVLRAGAAVTVLALAGGIVVTVRRERRQREARES
jgi:protein SCO1/2